MIKSLENWDIIGYLLLSSLALQFHSFLVADLLLETFSLLRLFLSCLWIASLVGDDLGCLFGFFLLNRLLCLNFLIYLFFICLLIVILSLLILSTCTSLCSQHILKVVFIESYIVSYLVENLNLIGC